MRQPYRLSALNVLVGMTAVVLAAAILVGGRAVGAQNSSPDASPPTVACDIEPRTDEDLKRLAALAATPAADTPDLVDGSLWIEGTPVDTSALLDIERTLDLVAACAGEGDVARLLALYTDAYIVREILATEPVPIVPGTPDQIAPGGTPAAAGSAVTIDRALSPAEGQITAFVIRDGRAEVMWFVEVDGMWRIDAIANVPTGGATPDLDANGSALLPPVRAAVADAAETAGVLVGEVIVVSVEPTVWSDSSLGCPKPDEFYAQVQTPGYIVTLNVAGTEVTYHTDEGEAAVPCEAGGS